MSAQWHFSKMIGDPIYGLIEVSPILPMIETREFQALADRRQLGLSSIVFPSATHTRFAHSVGAYHATRELADRWIKLGFINAEEGDAMAAHALYHDIGHPAFSHVTEDFCPFDHKRMTTLHVERLKGAVEASGVNHDLLLKLVRHEHPLWVGVADKNIGMEKLDYLERDGLFTVQSRPPGVNALRKYVYFVDGMMVVDGKVMDYAIHTQNFYMEMYKNVYFRKSLVITQRMFHKIVHHLIVAGELAPSELYSLTDFELMAKVIVSQEPTVWMLYRLLRERTLFKETIALRTEAFAHETRIADKTINVCKLSEKEMQGIITSPALQKENHESLERLENAITDLAGIPRGEVLLVPVFNPGRFKAQDIMVLGSNRRVQSLQELRPDHFRAMEEMARSYVTLRVCTLEKHRAHLSSPDITEKVLTLLFSK